MQHHKPECHTEKLVHCVQCQGHSEGLCNQKMTISVVSSKRAGQFATRLGLAVYYHEAMCHAEQLVHFLQCQGYSKGLNNQNMTIFTISSNCWSICNQTWFDSTAS